MGSRKQKEFESGQHVNGVYEFDTTETFIRSSGIVDKPGALVDGDVVRVYRFPKHVYRVVGKRMEGKKLVIKCDRVNSDDILFHVTFKPKKDTPILVGVEGVVRNGGTSPSEYLTTIRGKKKWVKANECDYAAAPDIKLAVG
jgi:hypothetical protein